MMLQDRLDSLSLNGQGSKRAGEISSCSSSDSDRAGRSGSQSLWILTTICPHKNLLLLFKDRLSPSLSHQSQSTEQVTTTSAARLPRPGCSLARSLARQPHPLNHKVETSGSRRTSPIPPHGTNAEPFLVGRALLKKKKYPP
jgi:hypothetical protein